MGSPQSAALLALLMMVALSSAQSPPPPPPTAPEFQAAMLLQWQLTAMTPVQEQASFLPIDSTRFLSAAAGGDNALGAYNSSDGKLLWSTGKLACTRQATGGLPPFLIISVSRAAYICNDAIHAFSLKNGSKLWSTVFPAGASPYETQFGGVPRSSDGSFMVVGVSWATPSNQVLSGAMTLDVETGAFMPGMFQCPNAGADPPLLIRSLSTQGAIVSCIQDGFYAIAWTNASRVLWYHPHNLGYEGVLPIVAYNEDVVYQAQNASIVRVNRVTGATSWISAPQPAQATLGLAGVRGGVTTCVTLIVALSVTCVDYATGSVTWVFNNNFDDGIMHRDSQAIPSLNIVVTRDNARVLALNVTDGSVMWILPALGYTQVASTGYTLLPPASAPTLLIATSQEVLLITNLTSGEHASFTCTTIGSNCPFVAPVAYFAGSNVVVASAVDGLAGLNPASVWSRSLDDMGLLGGSILVDDVAYIKLVSTIAAVSAVTGDVLWTAEQESSNVVDQSPPMVFAGYLVASQSSQAFEVVDAITGTFVTTLYVDNSCSSSEDVVTIYIALQDGDDYIYFVSNKCLFRIDRSLRMTHVRLPLRMTEPPGPPVLCKASGMLLIASVMNIVAINTTSFTDVAWIYEASAAINVGLQCEMWMAFAAIGSDLLAFDTRTGTILWSEASGAIAAPLLVYNGSVIATDQYEVSAFSVDIAAPKRVLWQVPTSGNSLSTNFVATSNGVVIAAAQDALMAFHAHDGAVAWVSPLPYTAASACTTLTISGRWLVADCMGLSVWDPLTGQLLATSLTHGSVYQSWVIDSRALILGSSAITLLDLPAWIDGGVFPPVPTLPTLPPADFTLPPNYVPPTPAPQPPPPYPSVTPGPATTGPYKFVVINGQRDASSSSLNLDKSVIATVSTSALSYMNLVSVWNATTGKLLWNFTKCNALSNAWGAFAATTQLFYQCGTDLHVHSIATGALQWTAVNILPVTTFGKSPVIVLSPSGAYVAVSYNAHWAIVEVATGTIIVENRASWLGPDFVISAVVWPSEGSVVPPSTAFVLFGDHVELSDGSAMWNVTTDGLGFELQGTASVGFGDTLVSAAILPNSSFALLGFNVSEARGNSSAATVLAVVDGTFSLQRSPGQLHLDTTTNTVVVACSGTILKLAYTSLSKPFGAQALLWKQDFGGVRPDGAAVLYDNLFAAINGHDMIYLRMYVYSFHARHYFFAAIRAADGSVAWYTKCQGKSMALVADVVAPDLVLLSADDVALANATSGVLIWNVPAGSKPVVSNFGGPRTLATKIFFDPYLGVQVGVVAFSGTPYEIAKAFLLSPALTRGFSGDFSDAVVIPETGQVFIHTNGVVAGLTQDGAVRWTRQLLSASSTTSGTQNMIAIIAYAKSQNVIVCVTNSFFVLLTLDGDLVRSVPLIALTGTFNQDGATYSVVGEFLYFTVGSQLVRLQLTADYEIRSYDTLSSLMGQSMRMVFPPGLVVFNNGQGLVIALDNVTLAPKYSIIATYDGAPVAGLFVYEQFLLVTEASLIVCYNARDGSFLWQQSFFAIEGVTFVGGYLYLVSSSGVEKLTLKVELAPGENRTLMRLPIAGADQLFDSIINTGSSVLVVVTQLVVMGLDAETLEILWSTASDATGATTGCSYSHLFHNDALIFNGVGVSVVLACNGGVAVIDVATGDVLYFLARGAQPTVAVGNGVVLIESVGTGNAGITLPLVIRPAQANPGAPPPMVPQTIPPGYHVDTPAPTTRPAPPLNLMPPLPFVTYSTVSTSASYTLGFTRHFGDHVHLYVTLVVSGQSGRAQLQAVNGASGTVLATKTLPIDCGATWLGRLGPVLAAYQCGASNTLVAFNPVTLAPLWTAAIPVFSISTAYVAGHNFVAYDPAGGVNSTACLFTVNDANDPTIYCINIDSGAHVFSVDQCTTTLTPPIFVGGPNATFVTRCDASFVMAIGLKSHKVEWQNETYVPSTATGIPDLRHVVVGTGLSKKDLIVAVKGANGNSLVIFNALTGAFVTEFEQAAGQVAPGVTIQSVSADETHVAIAVGSSTVIMFTFNAVLNQPLRQLWTWSVDPIIAYSNSAINALIAGPSTFVIVDGNFASRATTTGSMQWNTTIAGFSATDRYFMPLNVEATHYFLPSTLSSYQFFVNTTSRTSTWMWSSTVDLDTEAFTQQLRFDTAPQARCAILVMQFGLVCVKTDIDAWSADLDMFSVGTGAAPGTFGIKKDSVYKIGADGAAVWGTSVSTSMTPSASLAPLVVGDAIVAGTDIALIAVLDAATGVERFLITLPVCNPAEQFSNTYSATPAPDGIAVFLTAGVSCVYRIDMQSGAVRTYEVLRPVTQPPLLLPGGRLIAFDSFGLFVSFNVSEPGGLPGDVQWTRQLGFAPDAAIAATAYGNVIVVIFNNDLKVLVPEDGGVAFSERVGTNAVAVPYNGGAVVLSELRIAFYSVALELPPSAATSRLIWNMVIPSAWRKVNRGFNPIISESGVVAFAAGTQLTALNATNGATLWSIITPKPCTTAIAYKSLLIASCESTMSFDLASGAVVRVYNFGVPQAPELAVASDRLVYVNYNNFVESVDISADGHRPNPLPPQPTSPPPTGTLPPSFTPLPPFTGVATLPPGSTHLSLGCVDAVDTHFTALVACLNQTVIAVYDAANHPGGAVMCKSAASLTLACRSTFIRSLSPQCASGMALLQSTLSSLNTSAFLGFCAAPTQCADGEAQAAALCDAMTVPAAAGFPGGGATLPPSVTFPAPANSIPTFTRPPFAPTTSSAPTTTADVTTTMPPATVTVAPSTQVPAPSTPTPSPPSPATPSPTPLPLLDSFRCVLRNPPLVLNTFRLRLQGILSQATTLPDIAVTDVSGVGNSDFTFEFTGDVATAARYTRQLEQLIISELTYVEESLQLVSIAVVPLPTPAPTSETSAPAPEPQSMNKATVAIAVVFSIIGAVFAGFAGKQIIWRRKNRRTTDGATATIPSARGNEMTSLLPTASDTTASSLN